MTVIQSPLAAQDASLPSLRSKPSFKTLRNALESLAIQPNSWTGASDSQDIKAQDPKKVNRYLLSVVSSDLSWLEDGGAEEAVVSEQREKIWELASKRMAERCGRTAMPEMTRTWLIPSSPTDLQFSIREPPLTGDNLGFKTWGTAFTIAKLLDSLGTSYFSHLLSNSPSLPQPQILELGAGTGLVGIAAAAIWRASVLLTDLPAIYGNLTHNAGLNEEIVRERGGRLECEVLDWNTPVLTSDPDRKFDIVIAADPLYDEEHPSLVSQTIAQFLKRDGGARALVAVPLRDAKTEEMAVSLGALMARLGLGLVGQGKEVFWDDWGEGGEGGDREGVRCWWGVWRWGVVE